MIGLQCVSLNSTAGLGLHTKSQGLFWCFLTLVLDEIVGNVTLGQFELRRKCD